MKKMMILAMMMAMTVAANAMSYKVARDEALFLSDKMAYELNLSTAQYDAVYEINLDYLLMVDSRADVRGIWWDRRNADLRYVLTPWQYEKYARLSYFFTPVAWRDGVWHFNVYTVYTNRHRFFNGRPTVFADYRGGNNRRDVRFYAGWNAGRPPVAVNSNGTWCHTNNVNVDVNPRHNNHGADHNAIGNGGHSSGSRSHATPNRTAARPASHASGSFGAGRK